MNKEIFETDTTAPATLPENYLVNGYGDPDWTAFYRHMNAINSFLMAGGD